MQVKDVAGGQSVSLEPHDIRVDELLALEI